MMSIRRTPSLLLLLTLLLLAPHLPSTTAIAVPNPDDDCPNSGYDNSGCNNSGIRNSGTSNSGIENVGTGNSGIQNIGTGNSGIRNCGVNQSGVGEGCTGDEDWEEIGIWVPTTTFPPVVTVTNVAIGAVVTVTRGAVVGRRTDCAYWRAQGYTCDAGVKEGVERGVLTGAVLVGVLGAVGGW
ncbi:hypothetical protein EX30DRAFT_342196 [Ascodesmis nigricans]|uniref:Hydrophobin n=1 Tax=Ascodesmis nigricans TaxID=341454 RepID=A0A4S2MSW9_9PEZI|nr:hypothetical protein EX30DRAFT_342196 [Ascodesmis nigricans]